jgi:tetratricopeptide (TPR) repeat protein
MMRNSKTPRFAALASCLVLALPAATVAALPAPNSELRQYVHARLADVGGRPDAAAASYARLLEASPDDKKLALRTYRQALTAGNFKLASLAAQNLDKAKALPPDAVLMLLSDAVMAKDWDRSTAVINRIEREQVFSFLVPVMRGWIAFGKQNKDAAKYLAPTPDAPLANAYARDHYLLIALASGRSDVLAEIRKLIVTGDMRALRLQLATAAMLAKRGDTTNALALLAGRAPELVAARAVLDAGKVPAGAVDTPALGLAELFAQLAVDVKGEGRSPISLQLARLATYLAPDNSAAMIAAADLLDSNGYSETALNLLGRVSSDDPLWEAARQERGGILLASGDREAALVDARKVADRSGANAAAFVELGGILSELDRPAEAAKAFQRAIDIDMAKGQPNWAHLFLKASALDRAGDWVGAKALLLEANKLDGSQAVILNYLGYGLLDRGESLTEAQVYIEKASALDPNDAAITDSLGWLHYKLGDYARAIAALERAVASDPGQSVMNEHLGDAYWASGRRVEARYAWRAALVQADKPGIERINRKLSDGIADTASRQ